MYYIFIYLLSLDIVYNQQKIINWLLNINMYFENVCVSISVLRAVYHFKITVQKHSETPIHKTKYISNSKFRRNLELNKNLWMISKIKLKCIAHKTLFLTYPYRL